MKSRFKRKREGNKFHSSKRFREEKYSNTLDMDTYQYFSRISQVLKGKIDKQEMEILATNTLQQTEGIELEVCRRIVSATVLEKIIPYSPWSEVQRIIDALNKASDRKSACECRVEETFLKDAGRRVRLPECDEKENCLEYITNFSNNVLENFEKDIWDSNRNFVARTCLIVCSGWEEKSENKEIISKEIVLNFKKKLMEWSELADSYHQDIISGFLQVLLKSLKAVCEKKCKIFSNYLLVTCFTKNCEDSNLSLQFENTSWSRLLETIIDVSSPALLEEIYNKLFVNQMDTLVYSKKGQFPLCKLIRSCSEKLVFENVLEKVKDNFGDIFAQNQFSVLHSLSEACINTGHKQGDFVKYLATALGCIGPVKEKLLFICIISMKSVTEVDSEAFDVNFHGSLIMQNLLKFKKPQKLVEAFLSLNISTLKRILQDRKGSFIADAFMASTTVGAKAKERLIQTLKEHYSDLAVDKFGSRTFDVIWAVASLKIRKKILSEMTRQIKKTSYGSIIAAKTGLDMFIKDQVAWEKAYNSTNNTDLIKDITKTEK